MPKRIQLRRIKGWKLPRGAVSVVRPGKWGNPFKVNPGYPPEEAVADFERWINGEFPKTAITPPSKQIICEALGGKDLACWCKIGEACHGDSLLRIANGK